MNKKVEILAMGIDLANDYTQIAVIDNPDSNESKGIPASRGNTDCLIRSVLYISREGTWHIGDDAVKRAEMDGGECAEDIVNIMLSGGELQYNGSVYSAYELMRGYLNACIEHVRFLYVDISIKEICITAVDNPKVFTDNAYKALGTLGFLKENIRVISHSEAFIYYTCAQRREIWVNDVCLMDFTKDNFTFYILTTKRNSNPKVINVELTDYTQMFNIEKLSDPKEAEKYDVKLYNVILEKFRKRVFSTVFLTGRGFNAFSWPEQSMEELLNKRHVFKGYNLFVKGAVIAADKHNKTERNEFLFECPGRTKVDVGIFIMHDNKNMNLTLSKAGTNWHEAGATVECILDDINRFTVVITDPVSMFNRNISIVLPTFPGRPNKATRVRIALAYTDDTNMVIRVDDMGFGEFFKPSGVNLVKNINVSQLF